MEVALALIRHPQTDAILITRRRHDVHLGGLWEFPGGKCKPGELPPDCALRETQEETGLAVKILESWSPIIYQYPERMVTLHPFLCHATSDEVCLSASDEAAWVLPSEFDRYAFPPANAPLLARLVKAGIPPPNP